jgi:putative ABC transport system permease protein
VDVGQVSDERRQAIKQEVLGHPDVQQATIGDAVPGGFNVSFSVEAERLSSEEQTEQENVSLRAAKVDASYVETLGLALLAGRSFSADRATDRTQAYVLNREAVEAMGWTVEDAVGKPFTFARDEDAPMGKVIGVVENFHIESLRDEMSPVVLQMESGQFSSSGGILAAKLAPEGIRAGMDHIEQVMAQTVPEASFEYTFLDEEFDAMYRSEERLATIFTVFAGIAILVACMGLFGLAAFAAQRRTKEIGIRKALGASLANVVALLSKEFALLVGVALVLGAPVAYWGVQQWLQDFAYRIDVGPFAFVATAIVALVIAGGSVSVHALRAARTDPATALRTE